MPDNVLSLDALMGGPPKTGTVYKTPAEYRKLARQIAAEQGVDANLVERLITQESGFNPKAVSNKGARGLAQLMPSTARAIGVEDIDDPEQNLRGGITLLGDLLKRYNGDRTKAVAAYNAGPGAVDKAGGIPDFEETQGYVKAILGKDNGGASAQSLDDLMGGAPKAAAAVKPTPKAPQQASMTPATILKSGAKQFFSSVPAVQRAGRSAANLIEGTDRPDDGELGATGGMGQAFNELGGQFKKAPVATTAQSLINILPSLFGLPTVNLSDDKGNFSPSMNLGGTLTALKGAGEQALGGLKEEFGDTMPYSPAARKAAGQSVEPSLAERLAYMLSREKTGTRGGAAGVVQGVSDMTPADAALLVLTHKVGEPIVKGVREVGSGIKARSFEPVMGRETVGGRLVDRLKDSFKKEGPAPKDIAPPLADEVVQGMGKQVAKVADEAKNNLTDLSPRLKTADGGIAPQPGGALDRYVKRAIEEGNDVITARKTEKLRAANRGGKLGEKAPDLQTALTDALKSAGEAEKPPSVELPPSEDAPMPKLVSRKSGQGPGIPDTGGDLNAPRESGQEAASIQLQRARAERRNAANSEIDALAEQSAVDHNNKTRPRGTPPPKKQGGAVVETPRATSPEEVTAFREQQVAEAQATPGMKELPPLPKKGAAALSTPGDVGISATKSNAGDVGHRRRNLMIAMKRSLDKIPDSQLAKKVRRFHYLASEEKPNVSQLAEIGKLEREILKNPALPEKLKKQWQNFNAKVQARPTAEASQEAAGMRNHIKVDEGVQKNVKLENELRGAQRAAEVDSLTGAANRRALDRALPAAEKDPGTRVVAFDANNFGEVNKKVSQVAGDHMLKDLSAAIHQAAEEHGVGQRVFRRGGDEFVVLAPEAVADKVRARAEEIFGTKKAGEVEVSLSGTTGNTFAEADSILQSAKAARKAGESPQTANLQAAGEAAYKGVSDEDLMQEFHKMTDEVNAQDKNPDHVLTPEQAQLHAKDWKGYSSSRGFTEEQIGQYEKWLHSSFEMSRRGLTYEDAAAHVEKSRPITERGQEAAERIFPEQVKAADPATPPEIPAEERSQVIDDIISGAGRTESHLMEEHGPLRPREQILIDMLNEAIGKEAAEPDIRSTQLGGAPPIREQITAPEGFTFGKGGRDRMSMTQSPEVRKAREMRTKVHSQFKNKPKPQADVPVARSVEDIKLSPAAGPDAKPIKRQTLNELKAAQAQELMKGAPKGVDGALWKEVQAVESAARDLIEQQGIIDPRAVQIMRQFWGSTETARRLGLETIKNGKRVRDRELVEQLAGSPHRQRPMVQVAAEMEDRFRFLMDNPNGFMKMEALLAGSTAMAGGMYGATMDADSAQDRAINAISMGLIGGGIGYGGAKALKGFRFKNTAASVEALDTAHLLASPAMVKASLGSMSGSLMAVLEQVLQGNHATARRGLRAIKESPGIYVRKLFAPTSTLMGPTSAQVVRGMGATGLPQKLLANVTRPFAAADAAGTHIMKAMGISQAEAERYTLMGEPTSWQGQAFLKFINQYWGLRMLAKFPRVRIQQMERGVEYMPGISQKFSPRSLVADQPGYVRGLQEQEGLSKKQWRAKKIVGTGVMVAGSAYGYWHQPSAKEIGVMAAAAGPAAMPASISMAAGAAAAKNKDALMEALTQIASSVPQINEADIRRLPERIPGYKQLKKLSK